MLEILWTNLLLGKGFLVQELSPELDLHSGLGPESHSIRSVRLELETPANGPTKALVRHGA